MDTRRDVFQAIADPTRRQIIRLLAQEPMNLQTIAENFDVTRPAISNHIRILHECGIITVQKDGRESICKIQPANLKEVSDWIGQFNTLWENRLNAFEKYVSTLNTKRKNNGRKK